MDLDHIMYVYMYIYMYVYDLRIWITEILIKQLVLKYSHRHH